MKIGITCYPTYGGSGVVATELGMELAKKGHNIHYMSYGLPFRLNKFHRNIFFHEVEMPEYSLFKYPPYSLSLSAKMVEVIESEKLDLLHVHYAMPHAASAYLAKKIIGGNRIKFITTLHGTDITLVGNHQSFYRITKFSIEESDGVTCVSNYLKETTARIFEINKEMEVIYNFVDTEKYKRTAGNRRDIKFVGKDDKVIMHISNFRPVKRIENIVKVFSIVSKEVKSKLLLVGDGPDICRIRIMVNKLNLEDKVLFMGIQENIIPLLNISDVYMLPSKSEGFGLSALEALSCEVPVIGTNVGGLKEVVEHGKSGFIINPEDIDSMSEAAIKILGSEETRSKMGAEARKRAKLFDSRLIVPKYLEYYKKILYG
ncbi:MAG: N-acetyl-alpha-D-glucosaminyl L-malate synthase BshA [Actinobacteria bacterium RBG_13_35_12]|nr:MAG: N-acetyl-alpha-D-glucosaminyl L-malate synthase BshA [Actinobacteria bacterium RBG_13_35_12]